MPPLPPVMGENLSSRSDVPAIFSERLELISLSPEFLEASLQGDVSTAEALLGLSISAEWFESKWLIQLRLSDLQQDSNLQPWLLRAVVLRDRKIMIGHIGFHGPPDAEYLREYAPGGAELGYTIFPAFRRRGYAREAAEALMRWGREEHSVPRFVVSIRPDNSPSLRLAERLGFRWVGSHIDEIDGLENIYRLDVFQENEVP